MTVLELIIKEVQIEKITKQDYYRLLATNRIEETSFIEELITSMILRKADMDGVEEYDIINYLLDADVKTFFTKIYKYKDRYITTL